MECTEKQFVSIPMSSPHFEAVFEALVAAVRCFPGRWSEEAQVLTLICAELVKPEGIIEFLDYAENLVTAARVVRRLPLER